MPQTSDTTPTETLLTTTETPATPETAIPPELQTQVMEDGWLKGIEKSLAEDPSMKAIQDMPALVKSYVHAQRMMGKNKVIIPGKEATEDEVKQFFMKVGLPESVDKYDIQVKNKEELDTDFLKAFKEAAYSANILPDQAQKLFDWYNEKMDSTIKSTQESQNNLLQEEVNNLKKEWGEGFDKKLSLAKQALKQFSDKDTMVYLEQSGLGNDTKLIRLFSKIGEAILSEDTFKVESVGDFGKTPSEAKAEVNEILGNSKSPYWNKAHPSHKDLVQRVNKLMTIAG